MLSASSILELDRLGLKVGGGRVIYEKLNLGSFVLGGENYHLVGTSGEGPLEAKLQVSKTPDGYAVKLEVAASLKGPCMRCLENAGNLYQTEAWEVEGGDSSYLKDGELKLIDWTRDLMGIQIPFKVLCSEECLGLCVQCGKNLNLEPHDHKQQASPRFPILNSWVKETQTAGKP